MLLTIIISSIADTKYCLLKISTDQEDIPHLRYVAYVDYGDNTGTHSLFRDDTNQDRHFNTRADAINKLASEGWEIVAVNDKMLQELLITFKKEEKKEEEQ